MQHLLGTPISETLNARAERVIALLRSDAPRDSKIEAADALIVELVRVGIDYHFRGPAQRFGLSVFLIKIIDVAAKTTLKALETAARRVLKGLSDEQLAGVADEIEERIFPYEVEE